jgi:hypothetical protein
MADPKTTEDELFYVEEKSVWRRAEGEGEPTWVCECSDHIEGAAEQIARSLNRLPKAEAMLVEVRGLIVEKKDVIFAELLDAADKIEAFILDGAD